MLHAFFAQSSQAAHTVRCGWGMGSKCLHGWEDSGRAAPMVYNVSYMWPAGQAAPTAQNLDSHVPKLSRPNLKPFRYFAAPIKRLFQTSLF